MTMQVVSSTFHGSLFLQKTAKPLLAWLESVDKTPGQFLGVMRSGVPPEEQASLLGLTHDAFCEGINKIGSLALYAQILDTTPMEVYRALEANSYIAPDWLIQSVEKAVQESMTCG
jgi:hypothetical protein